MFLKCLGKHHDCELACFVLSPRPQWRARVLETLQISTKVAGACAEYDPDIAIGGLGAKSGREDTEKVEVRKIINSPIDL